ncbi:1,5-anhydro-D-fructose reductase-like isoform X2 [Dermochelys coriacea]|uniref:1,5-anhydro-D-fructose reductase-like isoform X2 n=1 Tax=Dermochelys coriacea TaxID=27794 RepID=UPI001CA8F10A|nr:1,5-anhydro-D-fructose reductase-like isoform X2 [Dermochelys coriacea]
MVPQRCLYCCLHPLRSQGAMKSPATTPSIMRWGCFCQAQLHFAQALAVRGNHVVKELSLTSGEEKAPAWLEETDKEKYKKCPPDAVQKVLQVALDAGYRHFDCAYFYQNEATIGAAFQKTLGEGRLKRDELYVLWNSFHAPQDVKPAFLKSLTMLKLDYLDLYLMHSPMGFLNINEELMPQKDGLLLHSDVDYVDTWRAMEKLVDEGLVKSVGVSNFNISQLERLLSMCRIKPAANQVELHPYLTQPELVEFCKSQGIVLIAYSPLGGPALPCTREKNSPMPLLENPTVNEIAQKHGKTSAQVLIRFHLQRGIATIPKSVTPSHIVENAEVYDFQLKHKEIQMLEGLNCNTRFIKWKLLGMETHKHFPFSDE